jgi:hypothetical protein
MDAQSLAESFPPGFELPPEFRSLCTWVEVNGYPISGYFELCEHDDETIRCWFGSDAAVGELAQFGSGPDGSLYCLWRCSDGRAPIVHMGSEGENNIVLASSPVDFLRLLAVGYDEIGFADLDAPPVEDEDDPTVNVIFQRWVAGTFNTTVPKTGSEIVAPAQASHDDFQSWLERRCG